MSSFKKTFRFEQCKSCSKTCGKSQACRTCTNGSNHDELYDADPNCVHKLLYGNGVRCVKCNGWFCY